MKLVFTAFVVLSTGTFENALYVQKMKETLQEMGNCKNVEDFKKVANAFDRISKMEQKEWLPVYYNAYIHTILIYVDQSATAEQKDKYLDQAEVLIKTIEEMYPDEVEIQTLKAFLIASRMGLNPAQRGATMYPSYQAAVSKAQALAPKNPRARYLVLSARVGEARYFGNPIDPYCAEMKTLAEEWDAYKPVSEIHPSWGKDQLVMLLGSCS